MKYLWQSTSSNISTGYGILTKNVCERLIKKGVDLKILGMQNLGHQREEFNLPILDDVYCQDALQFYTKLYEIDYVITVLDNFVSVYHYIPSLLKKLKVGHICHCTINSAPLSPMLLNQIKGADFLVAPSKFAEKVLFDAGVEPKRIRYIAHGVNTKIFKPLPKEEIEEHKQMIGYKDKFVFLSVATNTGGEKNWPGLFYAYKIFLHQNPDAKEKTILHCHTNPHYPGGYDLELLGKMYGIAENLRFIAGVGLNAGTPPEEMVKLYNVADCYVSPTMGESFSLPALEAMACGIPCIIPNHSTGPEFGESKTGLLIDLLKMKNKQEFGWTGPTISDKWFIDPVDMADKMTEIYKNKKLREKFSKNAVKFAKNYDWEKKIIPQWVDFFEYVENFIEPVDYAGKKLGI